jgi:aminoglycoside phosphotransferase (APT) family kinase protein
MEFENAPAVVIRYPLPTTLRFPDEKIRNEVAVMRYVREHTSIPVPRVIYRGQVDKIQLSLGPFIIMEYAGHDATMYALLNTPGRPADLRAILDPDIAEEKLEMMYRQLAEILLKLSVLSFPRIGSLKQKDDSPWEVAHRPLTLNMEQMLVMGTLPPVDLPDLDKTFATSASYLESVAETFIQHFNHQRNDAIESADDCRRRFVARRLFQKLAREKKLTDPSLENGPFKLWCDDLRPANVIMDQNDHIVGVLDWEFSYAAPVEFTYAPPWWLLV